MSIEEQVDKDFASARHRALVGRLAALLPGKKDGGELLSFEEVRRASRANGGLARGEEGGGRLEDRG